LSFNTVAFALCCWGKKLRKLTIINDLVLNCLTLELTNKQKCQRLVAHSPRIQVLARSLLSDLTERHNKKNIWRTARFMILKNKSSWSKFSSLVLFPNTWSSFYQDNHFRQKPLIWTKWDRTIHHLLANNAASFPNERQIVCSNFPVIYLQCH